MCTCSVYWFPGPIPVFPEWWVLERQTGHEGGLKEEKRMFFPRWIPWSPVHHHNLYVALPQQSLYIHLVKIVNKFPCVHLSFGVLCVSLQKWTVTVTIQPYHGLSRLRPAACLFSGSNIGTPLATFTQALAQDVASPPTSPPSSYPKLPVPEPPAWEPLVPSTPASSEQQSLPAPETFSGEFHKRAEFLTQITSRFRQLRRTYESNGATIVFFGGGWHKKNNNNITLSNLSQVKEKQQQYSK